MDSSHTEYTDLRRQSQTSFNPLPAVVIGGPPHSGKSVLAYSLSRALRQLHVDHYVIRAYPPDYEGDWFQAGASETVGPYRRKGARSAAWLAPLQRDLAQRQLPLLVDFGGLPTAEQETLLDACTHAILLTPDAAARAEWAARLGAHGLVMLADVRSALHGLSALEAAAPVVQGMLSGLERGTQAAGPVIAAIVARLAALFGPAAAGLRQRHLAAAPAELAVDVGLLEQHFAISSDAWPPALLPDVLDYLPAGQPLALYGRGPNWLYAAIAAQALPADFYLFDPRLGWIAPPALTWGLPDLAGPLTIVYQPLGAATRLEVTLLDAYLELAASAGQPWPPVETPGLIVSGKLPHWLWTALARHYTAPDWLAVVQPQQAEAIVVRSRAAQPAVGASL